MPPALSVALVVASGPAPRDDAVEALRRVAAVVRLVGEAEALTLRRGGELLVYLGSSARALEFSSRARATPDAPPLLVLLADAPAEEERRRLFEAPADGLLLWPCDNLELAGQLALLARLPGPAAPGPGTGETASSLPGAPRDRGRSTFDALATSDVGTWHWYSDTERVLVDDNLARFFALAPARDGLPLEAFLARIHPDDRERVGAAARLTREARRDFDEEFRVVRPDESILWIHGRGRTERPAGDGPLLFAGVALDITALRTAQNAWFDAERRFRALLEATPDGFMIYHALRDPAGEIVDFECRFANAAAERFIGLGPRVGSRMLVDLPGHREDGLFDEYAGVVRGGRVWRREFRYTHDGIDGWFRCTAVPAGDGFAISFTDLTDLKRAEQRAEEEHSLLEAVLEACPAGIIFAGTDGRILRVNSANQRLWGPGPAPGVLGHELAWKGWWADDSARHGLPIRPEEWAMARALRGAPQTAGDIVDIEPFDAPGLRRTMINHGAPVRDRSGVVIGGVIVQLEVTEWRRAERGLRQSEERFRRLADSMPQLVWVADERGQVTYYNRRATAFSGIEPRPGGGWEWRPVLHPDDEAATVEIWRESVRTGAVYQAEHRLKMSDGSHRWHLSRAFVFQDPDGRRQWFGTATDIDEQKRHQEILERTVEQRTASLQTALAELETFSYSLAHDMRAPLRALTGFAQLLLEDHAPALAPEGQDMLRRIASAGARMDQLIRDVLCYSTVARAETPLQPVELRPLLEGILETYGTLRERDAEVLIEDSLPAVEGNEAMLMQVFSNLLANAVKFVPPERRPRVQVFAGDAGPGRVRLHVRDNGIGIAPEHHERIFRIFQRLGVAHEGTGIGLSVVQKAAERMGGRVGVESARGEGATFWVELRRAGEA